MALAGHEPGGPQGEPTRGAGRRPRHGPGMYAEPAEVPGPPRVHVFSLTQDRALVLCK